MRQTPNLQEADMNQDAEWKGPYRLNSPYDNGEVTLLFEYRVDRESNIVADLKAVEGTHHRVSPAVMKRFEKEVRDEAIRIEDTHDEPL